MSISLKKGQKVSLSKEKQGLSKVIVGLGWDEVKRKGGFFAPKPAPIDCDASALLLKNGRLEGKDDLVFYNHLTHSSGTVRHMGDNLTGAGEGDDEQIVIDLDRVPAEYDKIVIVVTIYQAEQRKQHFGLIENAFIRLVDGRNDQEILKYDLSEDYSGMTAMIFGEIYRYNGEWKFGAIGQGTRDGGIGEMAARFQR
ncbi:MAG: TerD family protein [Lachnospiraceae bacterium]|jgi:stress response protein SCP2|nr:TerD family protein [Lachnospiraceae bacterium]